MTEASGPDGPPDDAIAPETLSVAPPPEACVAEVAVVQPAPACDAVDTASATGAAIPPEESTAPVVDLSGVLGSIDRRLDELGGTLGRRLDGLQSAFEREIRAEATREKVVDRLHAELQEYKQDLLLSVMRPVFVDLIQLHDDVGKMIESRPDEASSLRPILEGVRQGIEDILYRQGVEAYSCEGDAFDPRRQRAVSTVATGDAGANKTIASRLRKGFQAGEKVIRPEIVAVFSYRAAT